MSNESDTLTKNILVIDHENQDLKKKLLTLINDYKLLKQLVINNDYNSKKRSFNEVVDPEESPKHENNDEELQSTDIFNSKVDQKDLDLNTDEKTELTRDDKLLSDYMVDDEDEFDDDVMDSPQLSRTSSPTDDDNSLMMSLTRSTTVSTNNSFIDRPIRFLDLPKFNDSNFMANDYTNHAKPFNSKPSMFTARFDVLQQDKYNLINDFLEEKLIDNDLDYYESLKHQDD